MDYREFVKRLSDQQLAELVEGKVIQTKSGYGRIEDGMLRLPSDTLDNFIIDDVINFNPDKEWEGVVAEYRLKMRAASEEKSSEEKSSGPAASEPAASEPAASEPAASEPAASPKK
jgi:phage protein D